MSEETKSQESASFHVPKDSRVWLALVLGLAGGGGMGTALTGGVSKEEFNAAEQRRTSAETRRDEKLDRIFVEQTNLRVGLERGLAEINSWRRDMERRIEKLEEPK